MKYLIIDWGFSNRMASKTSTGMGKYLMNISEERGDI